MSLGRDQLRAMASHVLHAQHADPDRFGEFIRRMVAATSMSPTMIMARVTALAA